MAKTGAAAAASQANPNESGSPRFVHPGWRVMTALLCWGAYLLPVVGRWLYRPRVIRAQGLEGPWKVNTEAVLCLSIPGETVCAFWCVHAQVCLCEGESRKGWGEERENLVSMATSSFNPPRPTSQRHSHTYTHPSPPDKNPGGLCVMRFH